MDLYTAQIHLVRHDPDLLDITVKSAGPVGRVFAPTWQMVMDHKKGIINDAVYTSEYHARMLLSYNGNRDKWDWVLAQPRIVLGCYCRAGWFCHRILLAEYLVKLGANYRGEL